MLGSMKNSAAHLSHLTRRGFLVAGGIGIAASRAFSETPGCTLTSEQEEGPYYVDDELLRRDITESRPGVPILLAVHLVDAKTCAPLKNAALDIWHCDAAGVYSGFTANSPDGPPGGPGGERGRGGPPPGFGPAGFRGGGPRVIDATRFLRGVQLSNDAGLVEFATVFPGWYSGRAIHIHTKVRVGGAAQQKYSGGHVAHTGQFFFPEELTEKIAQLQPYAKRLSVHRTTQREDGIFKSQHGAECMLTVERLGKSDAEGFRATATLAIDSEATPKPVGGRGPGGPPPRA